jgi:hypothetical protein
MEKEGTMQIPLQISFRNMDPSPAIEARIREKAAKLERFHDRIIGCTPLDTSSGGAFLISF